MCKKKYCESCNRKETCKGWIYDLYRRVVAETDENLLKTFKEYTPESIQQQAENACENDNELVYWMYVCYYKINRIMFTSAVFHGLCESWMYSVDNQYRYSSLLREKLNISSAELQEDTTYRKRLRFFDRLSKIHGIRKDELLKTSKDRFNITEFIIKYRENRKIRAKGDCDESLEHDRGFKRDLFPMMYEYGFPNTHQYRLPDFNEDLINIDIIYGDIKENSKNYFERCAKYKLVELWLHYETSYKFIKTLQLMYPDISAEEKTQLLDWEANLRSIKNAEDNKLIEFPLITGIEEYIKLFFMEYNDSRSNGDIIQRPNECAKLLGQLASVYNKTIDDVFNYISSETVKGYVVNFHISECMFAESLFKEYVGDGQHITENKKLDKEIVDNLIKIYKYQK